MVLTSNSLPMSLILSHKISFLFIYLFINFFKVDNDKKDTVYKNTYKVARG